MRFRARKRAKIRAFERAARHPCAFRETLREPLDPNCAFPVLSLEGIALEVHDLLAAMAEDARRPLARLRVDGGAAANDLLMQFQADVAGVTVERPTEIESTGRGAAMLAGVGAGLCAPESAAKMLKIQKTFSPEMSAVDRTKHLAQWRDAVRRARSTPAAT